MQNLLKNCLQYSTGEVVVSITQITNEPIYFPCRLSNGELRGILGISVYKNSKEIYDG